MKKEEYKTKNGFDIRLEARLKNAQLIGARESAGLTAREVAKELGISYPVYLAYESMKLFPNEERQKQICDFFRKQGIFLFEEDVFPDELKHAYFKRKYIAEKPIPKEKLISLSEYDKKLLPIVENEVEEILRHKDFDTILSERLNYREQEVIKKYFGLGEEPKTLGEIAKQKGLSKECIRRIKKRAICKLRVSKYVKILKEYL